MLGGDNNIPLAMFKADKFFFIWTLTPKPFVDPHFFKDKLRDEKTEWSQKPDPSPKTNKERTEFRRSRSKSYSRVNEKCP